MAPTEDLPAKLGTLTIKEISKINNNNNDGTEMPVHLNPFYFNVYPKTTKNGSSCKGGSNLFQRKNCDCCILSAKKTHYNFKSTNQKSSFKKIPTVNKYSKRKKDQALTALCEKKSEVLQEVHRTIQTMSECDCDDGNSNCFKCTKNGPKVEKQSTETDSYCPLSSTSKNPSPDDVTINELACYFDNFVHIPKKMSSMAEMMYI